MLAGTHRDARSARGVPAPPGLRDRVVPRRCDGGQSDGRRGLDALRLRLRPRETRRARSIGVLAADEAHRNRARGRRGRRPPDLVTAGYVPIRIRRATTPGCPCASRRAERFRPPAAVRCGASAGSGVRGRRRHRRRRADIVGNPPGAHRPRERGTSARHARVLRDSVPVRRDGQANAAVDSIRTGGARLLEVSRALHTAARLSRAASSPRAHRLRAGRRDDRRPELRRRAALHGRAQASLLRNAAPVVAAPVGRFDDLRAFRREERPALGRSRARLPGYYAAEPELLRCRRARRST